MDHGMTQVGGNKRVLLKRKVVRITVPPNPQYSIGQCEHQPWQDGSGGGSPNTTRAINDSGRMSIRPNTPMRWANPCGAVNTTDHDITDWSSHPEFTRPPSQAQWATMLLSLQDLAKRARDSYAGFRKQFETKVAQTLQIGIPQLYKEWGSVSHDWLPTIPKKLDKPTTSAHLKDLQFGTFLKTTTQWMQMVAVGLEQVAWDYGLDGENATPGFKQQFEDIFNKHIFILCNVETYASSHGETPLPVVGRDIMEEGNRKNVSGTFRDLRDWIIFKSHVTLIQYIIDCTEYFRNNPNKIV